MASQIPPVPFSELVFGFVYPIGVSADPVIGTFVNHLAQYGYESRQSRMSDQLRFLDLGVSFDDSTPYGKRDALIRAGNEARAQARDDRILAVMAVNDIASRREVDEQEHTKATMRTAHLVRSLKRPEEVELLREIYKSGFYLIGIASDDDAQMRYLTKELGIDDKDSEGLIERDQNEQILHGQRTRDTFHLADVFIQANEDQYKRQIDRFLEVVFGHPFITPSREEHAMFLAYASAARSAQLGRQVGAAIATPEGDVLAVGMNEVPSPNGGLYWEGDHEDQRDHTRPIDSNAEQRDLIIESVIKCLNNNQVVSATALAELLMKSAKALGLAIDSSELAEVIRFELSCCNMLVDPPAAVKSIRQSDIKSITEYGRAVHGEMDAILSCARLGIAVRGNYLYVTTFPCHNCTRHIIASGIRRVYYVEPYPKSKAKDLHSDAICFDENEAEATGKIPFLPFIGIGPRRYLDFFSLDLSGGRRIERKGEDNKPFVAGKAERAPRVPLNPLSYLEREDKLLVEFKSVLQELQGRPESSFEGKVGESDDSDSTPGSPVPEGV